MFRIHFALLALWNRLSNHIVSTETMGSFKRRLDKFMDEDDRWNDTVVLTQGLPRLCRSNGLLQLPSFSYVLMYIFSFANTDVISLVLMITLHYIASYFIEIMTCCELLLQSFLYFFITIDDCKSCINVDCNNSSKYQSSCYVDMYIC